ncbi:TlpA disulfide reductase family protein [Maribacter sp. 1_MG-2023]|uniref:TlpA family protein disulfide reductase n=1 Tax=Maribacter sp. 1_MG-2023 TaxID=3062677 RepID=UPI0026E14DA9|nr:TlpA disulfide reductase family protein [Maribacter sp. 1_MG-2023]MDO6472148.1 TlpA disulfide reductase family protein [Maribacter sp. 1_MG-2023]
MHLRIVCFLVLGVVLVSCKEEKTKIVEPEAIEVVVEKVSTSTYEDLEGNPIELSDYKGKRVLLNYWATWCRPCIEEMPDMEKAQTILEKDNYVFLFASDQSIDKINKFKEARGFQLDFIKFNGIYAEENVSALPATFIYNEVGGQVLRFDGGLKWDSPEMIEKLRAVQ